MSSTKPFLMCALRFPQVSICWGVETQCHSALTPVAASTISTDHLVSSGCAAASFQSTSSATDSRTVSRGCATGPIGCVALQSTCRSSVSSSAFGGAAAASAVETEAASSSRALPLAARDWNCVEALATDSETQSSRTLGADSSATDSALDSPQRLRSSSPAPLPFSFVAWRFLRTFRFAHLPRVVAPTACSSFHWASISDASAVVC
mmetsp:Transcript_13765/g.43539  ORF Transcript_13765/g.43539 Transcript_13765/m.43539 type:complete len:207 (-) Transcript_13765:600-1220(-)